MVGILGFVVLFDEEGFCGIADVAGEPEYGFLVDAGAGDLGDEFEVGAADFFVGGEYAGVCGSGLLLAGIDSASAHPVTHTNTIINSS